MGQRQLLAMGRWPNPPIVELEAAAGEQDDLHHEPDQGDDAQDEAGLGVLVGPRDHPVDEARVEQHPVAQRQHRRGRHRPRRARVRVLAALVVGGGVGRATRELGGAGVALATDCAANHASVTLGVRPDDLLLTPRASDGAARVVLIEHLGPRAIVTLEAHGTALTSVVETARLAGIGEGARVDLTVRDGGTHLFDTHNGRRLVGIDNG